MLQTPSPEPSKSSLAFSLYQNPCMSVIAWSFSPSIASVCFHLLRYQDFIAFLLERFLLFTRTHHEKVTPVLNIISLKGRKLHCEEKQGWICCIIELRLVNPIFLDSIYPHNLGSLTQNQMDNGREKIEYGKFPGRGNNRKTMLTRRLLFAYAGRDTLLFFFFGFLCFAGNRFSRFRR